MIIKYKLFNINHVIFYEVEETTFNNDDTSVSTHQGATHRGRIIWASTYTGMGNRYIYEHSTSNQALSFCVNKDSCMIPSYYECKSEDEANEIVIKLHKLIGKCVFELNHNFNTKYEDGSYILY